MNGGFGDCESAKSCQSVASWGQLSISSISDLVSVQPLKLPILQVKVLPQELPIYLGSDIRLRRRRRILSKLGSKKLVGLFSIRERFRSAQELSNTGGRSESEQEAAS